MKKLIPTGMIFLILSTFVSPAIAADSVNRENNEHKLFTVKSDEKTAKFLEFLKDNQNVPVYNAESEEDLIRIAGILSEEFRINKNDFLKSIERASDQPAETNFPEKLVTKIMDQCSITIIVIIVGSNIYVIYIV